MSSDGAPSTYGISVIIPAYNSHLTLHKTYEGVAGQTAFDRIDEIIIVDSSDKSEALAQLEELRKKEKVVVITSGIRVIPAVQRNIGAKHAQSKVLCFIDSDAFPADNWIEKILEAYEGGTRVGGGSFKIPDFQEDLLIARAQYYLEFHGHMDVGKPRHMRMIPTCNLYCDRELFFQVGGFPEIRASEDTLFGLSVNQIEKVMFFPDISIYHIFRESREHYLHNQVLLGTYIFIYRKYFYNSFYYNGFLPYIFFPGFQVVKLFRILSNILPAGRRHMARFIPAIPLFLQGLHHWNRGLWAGVSKYKTEESLTELNGFFSKEDISVTKQQFSELM